MAERQNKLDKKYIDAEGKPYRSAFAEAKCLRVTFSNGEALDIVPENFPAAIQRCAMYHGLSQKFTDGCNKSEPAECNQTVADIIEQLMEGDWITQAEGGAPRVTMLVKAYTRAKLKVGVEMTEERALEIVKNWDSDKRKAASNVPEIAIELAELQLEAARERAKKAKEALKGSEGTGLAGL